MNTSHRWIAVCGASGFVGSHLVKYLSEAGHTIVPLGRDLLDDGAEQRLESAIAECDTVINVAGLSINHRWNERYKRAMYESRVGVARKLVAAIRRTPSVHCWVCVSAVGYYPSEGCYDEFLPVTGDDFLSRLCQAWEAEAQRALESVRTVITRFGPVMASHGGAFGMMAKPARMAVAVATGNGRQPFSWIDIVDLCRAMAFVIDSQLGGVFNFVAPQQLTQEVAVRLIQAHYHAKIRIRIPEFLLRMVWGEAADFLVKGQCVMPARLLEAGFEFRSPNFETFLKRLPK